MIKYIIEGLMIPFLGTAAGAVLVCFMKRDIDDKINDVLTGLSAGVMTAASVWSLLIPSIERSAFLKVLAFLPAAVGLIFGMAFLIVTDTICERLRKKSAEECPEKRKVMLLIFAVVLHNIPEGMAVGIAFSGLSGNNGLSLSEAMALSIGIAIQNLPEGAIISLPLAAQGMKRGKACLYGILSGSVEPVAGLLTVMLASIIMPLLPYMLSFAAGCMLFVVANELLSGLGSEKKAGSIMFIAGFAIMMILDVALG